MEIGIKLELCYQVKTSDLAKALSIDPQDDFSGGLRHVKNGRLDGNCRSTTNEAIIV